MTQSALDPCPDCGEVPTCACNGLQESAHSDSHDPLQDQIEQLNRRPDAAEVQRRRDRSRAARCEDCGTELAEAVFRIARPGINSFGQRVEPLFPFCWTCFRDYYAERVGHVPAWAAEPRTCEGCGRAVYEPPSRRRHVICSPHCERISYNRRRSARRRAERMLDPRRCPECGDEFQPSRADHVYCCGGCRVRAHRERVAEGAT